MLWRRQSSGVPYVVNAGHAHGSGNTKDGSARESAID